MAAALLFDDKKESIIGFDSSNSFCYPYVKQTVNGI